jgi:hypothetical protein
LAAIVDRLPVNERFKARGKAKPHRTLAKGPARTQGPLPERRFKLDLVQSVGGKRRCYAASVTIFSLQRIELAGAEE